jgi:hypothetical protein
VTFKASNQTTADAYANIKRQAASTKVYMTQQATAMQAATSEAWVPLQVIQHLRDVIALMDGWAATPGLAAYAQAQENDAAYNVASEYTAMRNAMVSARDSLIGMFPTSGGFLAYQTMDASGNLGVRTFTAAQLASVVTLCNNVAATIS